MPAFEVDKLLIAWLSRAGIMRSLWGAQISRHKPYSRASEWRHASGAMSSRPARARGCCVSRKACNSICAMGTDPRRPRHDQGRI